MRVREVLVFFALIGYLLSPFDLIPEAVFGVFGLLDDLLAFLLFLFFLAVVVRQIVRFRR